MGQSQSSNNVSSEKTFSTDTQPTKENNDGSDELPLYPTPTGHEYDEIDKLQSELPAMIDEESRQQVDDYTQACDKGKGPMVACFATAEYLSMFERKVRRQRGSRCFAFSKILTVHYIFFSIKKHSTYSTMCASDPSETNLQMEKKWMARRHMHLVVLIWQKCL